MSSLAGPVRAYPDVLAGFRAAVAANPHAVAAACGEIRLTYGDVDRRSDALAETLTAVAPGRTVALYLHRGPDLATAVLACLKAGLAFLPLGVDDPPPRLRVMWDIAEPGCVVVDGSAFPLDRVRTVAIGAPCPAPLNAEAAPLNAEAAPLNAETAPLNAEADAVPSAEAAAAGPAYQMFTSGSTGTPKCVRISRAALANRIGWAQETFALTPADVVLQKTPYTFDVAVWEIVWPLSAGAATEYLPPGAHRDPGALQAAIRAAGVTRCHFVPSMMDEWLRWPGTQQCRSLRDVLCSGEPLTAETVRRFASVLPQARLHNLYGPTEAAIDVTHWAVPAPLFTCEQVLIGSPVANTAIEVVDERLRPVPVGQPGELIILGVQVADGYVGAPDLTAKAFVVTPDGRRAYRTGDRVRVGDGGIAFLGRLDDQVKIRGVRVEPGESEAALLACAGVVDAAVVAAPGPHGPALAAFVVPDETPGDSWPHARAAARIRRELATRLPSAYIPTVVEFVDGLPTTVHGKRDRATLSARAVALLAEEPADGGDDLERAWTRALGHRADPADGFMDAGGDSLRAARLAAELARTRGIRPPLAWLVVDNASLLDLRERLVVAEPGEPAAPGPVPLGAGLRQLWLYERIHGTLAPYNVVSGLVVAPRLDADTIRGRLAEAIGRHDAMRMRFDTGEPAGSLTDGFDPPLTVGTADAGRDFAVQTGELLQRLQETEYPSGRPPLFEVVLLHDPVEDRTAVAYAGSHLMCDQQSVDQLWRELLAGQAPAYAPSYHAHSPSRYAAEVAGLADSLAYWRKRLEDLPTRLRLPFMAEPRAGVRVHTRQSGRRQLSAPEYAALRSLCAPAGLRTGSVLLTAYAAVLSSWSGQAELIVGVPFDARRTVEEAGMFGFFVQSLPVPVALDWRESLLERCRGVQREVDTAAAFGHAGLDDIARALHVPRDGDESPLYQAWFNDLSGLRTEEFGPAVAPPRPPALFDVGLYVDGVGGGLDLRVTCSDRFPPSVADLLAEAVAHVVRTLLADPGATAGDCLPRTETPQTADWPRRDPAELSERFLRHAASDRVALRLPDTAVTYRELAAAVQQRRVELSGRPPGTVASVVAERGADLAATVLAAWAEGVPLLIVDSHLPSAYAEAAVKTAQTVPPGTSHLLLTSGTTGAPRVVAIPAAAFTTALLRQSQQLAVGAEDRIAVLSGAGHDPIFRDLLLPLVLGGCAAVPDRSLLADPARLLRWLGEQQVTVLHLTPGRAELLAAAAGGRPPPNSVRTIVVGGGPLYAGLAQRLYAAFPGALVHNGYGITEIAQLSSLHPVPRDVGRAPAAPVPIGRGAAGRALVVMQDGRPAGVGQLGEIAVVTSEPIATVLDGELRTLRLPDGRTAVLTGDLGRIDPDGQIVWSGRSDRQLSVAGYRVEADEVESRLLEDDLVAQALVAPDGDAGLCAYVTLRPGVRPAAGWTAALQTRLRGALPTWSVPREIHIVTHIALQPNGKPDAEATARLHPAGPPTAGGAPPTRTALAAIIDRHLPGERSSAGGGNFFELGFDSLGLLRLVSDLNRSGYPELTLIDLFRWPNLDALAGGLHRRGGPAPTAVALSGSPVADRRRQIRALIRTTQLGETFHGG